MKAQAGSPSGRVDPSRWTQIREMKRMALSSAERLQDLLTREIGLYAGLLQLIRQERECRKRKDGASLIRLLPKKKEHLVRIRRLQNSFPPAPARERPSLSFREILVRLNRRLPEGQAFRLARFQRCLLGLQGHVRRLEGPDRQFLREGLEFLREVFSRLLSEEEERNSPGGRTSSKSRFISHDFVESPRPRGKVDRESGLSGAACPKGGH